jgi:hypothetical protein
VVLLIKFLRFKNPFGLPKGFFYKGAIKPTSPSLVGYTAPEVVTLVILCLSRLVLGAASTALNKERERQGNPPTKTRATSILFWKYNFLVFKEKGADIFNTSPPERRSG